MFCNQCEQTAKGTGCSNKRGVCGKDEDIQSLQETLLYGVKGLAAYANHARRLGKSDEAVSAFIEEALFSTLTNVNFDLDTLLELVLDDSATTALYISPLKALAQDQLRAFELLYDAPASTEKLGA